MASLIRPMVTTWVLAGKRVKPGTPGAKKVRKRARKWYGQNVPGYPRNYRPPLSTDRRAAEKMLADLISKSERGRAGIPQDEPLGPLLDEWAASIDGEETHKREVLNHARSVLAAVSVETVSDLRGRGVVARVERFLHGLGTGDVPLSGRTAAAYGMHTRQFTRWLWRKRELLDADPLAGLDLPSQKPRTPRRDLTAPELEALLRAAEVSGVVVKGLTGTDRLMLYWTAICTGYRAGELAALCPHNFHLDLDPPVVRLSGEYTKNGKDAEQPIPAQFARSLQPYLAPKPRLTRVWRGQWFKKAPALLRADLAAAGLPARTPGYRLDFHCLRHTFVSRVAAVAPAPVLRELARHADVKTTMGYAHASEAAKAEAVAALPLPGGGREGSPLAGLSRADLEGLTVGLMMAMNAILNPAR